MILKEDIYYARILAYHYQQYKAKGYKLSKLIAFYLPQFHEIPENNEWWGEGFTEWTNVKQAQLWFNEHRQPRIPYNRYYYDLTDPKAQEWQSDLALKYGLGGFCYYHYWFNGKLLLEKPMENMLHNPKIKIPFCISWANEPWTRSWDGGKKKILINQSYGSEEDWKKHFDYLLPFFKDDRYIRVDNKPVFLIYRYPAIKNGDEMLEFFQKLAKESGLDGLHIVSTIHGRSLEYVDGPFIDAFAQFEPMYTLIHRFSFWFRLWRFFKRNILGQIMISLFGWLVPCLRNVDYDLVNEKIGEGLHYESDKPIYNGTFVGWDNTPRRGIDALIFQGEDVGKFGKYLGRALDIALENKSPFVFINAWNEWAEGAYLEPDIDNCYGYLGAVKEQLKIRGL